MLKKILVFHFLMLILLSFNVKSQTFFNLTPTAIPDNNPEVCSDIVVAAVTNPLNLSYSVQSICLDITHTFDSDLDIFIEDPIGNRYMLSTDNGGAGDNYSSTCFTWDATTLIQNGTAPFAGNYGAEYCIFWHTMAAFGINPNGTWRLCITDDFAGDVGTLNSWSITFGPVDGTTTAADFCSSATAICNLDGYTGNTSSCYSIQDPGNHCGSVENNSWLSFEADDDTASFDVQVSSCTNAFPNDGIQMGLYDDCTFANQLGCFFQIVPGINTVEFTGLIPGGTYYMMIDGFAGDVCDYSLTVNSGVSVVDITATPSASIVCGASVSLTASAGIGYAWSAIPADPTLTGQESNQTVNVSPTANTTYDVVVTSGNPNCPVSSTASTSVVVQPITSSFTVSGDVCIGDVATITYTGNAPGTATYSWNFDGGNVQTGSGQGPYTVSWTGSGTKTIRLDVDDGACSSNQTQVQLEVVDTSGSFSGLNAQYCLVDAASTLTGTPPGFTFSGPGISGTSFDPASAGLGTHTISYTFDVIGNATTTVNQNALYDDFSTDMGWTGYGGSGDWERVSASTGANCTGSEDPATDNSPSGDNMVLGTTVGGCYAKNLGSTFWITSPVIDLTNYTNVNFDFYRWLGIESSLFDQVYIQVWDGSSWVTIFANAGAMDDAAWVLISYNISAYADGNANFQIRFGLGVTDNTVQYCGWNIDDVRIYGDFTSVTSTTLCTKTVTETTEVISGPTANAGSDATICAGSTYTLSGSVGGGATSNTWSSSGTGSFNNASSLSAIYTPSAADVSGGSVTLTLTTNDPPGSCVAASDAMVLTINPAATVNAGANATICEGSTYTLSGSIGGSASSSTWTTSGSGSFNNASSLTAIYTPSAADISSGSVTLTLTTNDPAGPCPSVNDNMVITINPNATSNAGTDATVCAGSNYTLSGSIGGSASSGTWTSSGTGSFNNSSLMNAIYTPSAADISGGTVTLTLTTNDPAGPCPSANDNMVLTINPVATANASSDASICEGSTYTLSGTIGGAAVSGIWNSSGSGSFNNASSMTAIYTPSAADISSGSVTLTLTTNDPAGPCPSASDAMILTINPIPTASAGVDDVICQGSTYSLSGSIGGSASSSTWTTSGSGSFNNASLTNAIYTPSAGDISSGSVTLTITTNDPPGPCPAASDNLTLTIDPLPTANAGGDQTICEGSVVSLSGAIGGSASSSTWTTSGSGSFNNATLVNANYTPSAGDISSGTVTLTLTTNDPAGPCTAVNDVMVVTINSVPTASAGSDGSICAGNTYTLSGSIGGAASSSTWSSSGSGSFNNAALTNAIYTPSAADITAGTVTLTITTNDPAGPCTAVSDALTLTIDPLPTVNAGADQTTCEGAIVSLSGAIGGSASSSTWSSSGTGTFSNASSLTSTYTPSAADISSGSITLTLTTNDPPGACTFVTDNLVITINPIPTASASTDDAICAGSSYTLAGSFGGAATSSTWSTSGTGTFNNASLTNAIYTPSAADVTSGSVTLTITTNDPAGPCTSASDNMILTIDPSAGANAGSDQTVCEGDVVSLSGSISGAASSSTWTTSGSGTFSNAALLTSTYTPSAADITAGTATLTLTTNDPAGACPAASDFLVLTINTAAVVSAGSDAAICETGTYTLSGTSGGSTTTTTWSTSGSGSFDNSALLAATYTPSAADISAGTVTLTISSNNPAGPCNAVSDAMVLSIDPAPIANAGSDQTICESSGVTMSATIGGSATLGVWNTSGTGTFDNSTSMTAVYTPSAADITAGTVTLTLTTNNPPNSCNAVSDAMVVTIDPEATANAGVDAGICEGSTYTLSGSIGGAASSLTWTTSGSGTFNNASLAAAIYTPSGADATAGVVTLYITTDNPAGNCNAAIDSMELTITPLDDAGFNYGAGTFCQTGSDPTPAVNLAGGTFSSVPAGLVFISTSTGEIDVSASTVGAYTVTYTTAAACPNTSNAGITITLASDADFSLAGPYCQDEVTNPFPSYTTGSPGTFSADNGGLIFVSTSTGEINLSASTAGTYWVYNNIAASGGCAAAIDSFQVTVEQAATVNAGANATICSSDTYVLGGTIGGSSSSATWTTGGDGTFDNAALNNAEYTPGPGDISGGSVSLTFTSDDPAGVCNSVSDLMVLTINPEATTNANSDQTICEGSTVSLSGTIGGSAISSTWTTSGSGSFDNAGSLTAVYTPSAGDITAGSITLTITTNDPAGVCGSVSDFMVVTINPAATVSADIDGIICEGSSYLLNGTFGGGASSILWTTSGDGTFDNSALPGATYDPGPVDITNGTVTLTISTDDPDGAGPCSPISDFMVLTIDPAATVVAGANQTLCEGSVSALSGSMGGAAASITWTTGGDGTFDNASALSANYTPGAGDIGAGTVMLYITSNDPAGLCGSVTDSLLITITNSATSSAGLDDAICENSGSYVLSGTFGGGASSILWTTSGDGTFDNSSLPGATYTPGATDVSTGSVSLTITTDDPDGAGPCSSSTDFMVLTIDPVATVGAGTDQTICESSVVALSGTMGGSASTSTWSSSGDGSFDNNSALNANYTPGASDISSGSVTLYITSDDPVGLCNAAVDSLEVTINSAAIANAGIDDVICELDSVILTGSIGGGASSLTWTTAGDGSFDNINSAAAVYTPGSADISGSSVTLTLTSDDPDGAGPCLAATDNMQVTIDPAATVNAGPDQAQCQGASIALSGTMGGAATSVIWSTSGDGSFDVTTSLTPNYTPGAGDIASGTVVIYITSNDPIGLCATAIDSMVVSLNTSAIASAGADSSVCEGSTVTLNGSFSGASTITWTTSGDGTFDNSALTNATYTPGASDISSGLVTLTITTDDPDGAGPCTAATDDMILSVSQAATVSAGSDVTICEGDLTTLGGSLGGSSSTGTWSTSGDGSFSNVNSLTSDYTPGSNDISSGNTTLFLTSDDPVGVCNIAVDSILVTINPAPSISAGPDAGICIGDSHTLAGSVSGSASSGTWTTSGDGTFDNDLLLAATYSPGVADIAAGTVTLTITSDDPDGAGPCSNVTDDIILVISNGATAFAGNDTAVCEDATITLNGSFGGAASTITWTTLGDGSFSNINSPTSDYIPGVTDLSSGSVQLIITTDDPSGACIAAEDTVLLSIDLMATVNPGINDTICEGSSVLLSGLFGGSASSSIWSSTGDGSFDNTSLTNATYTPGSNDILIGNSVLTLTTDDPVGECNSVNGSVTIEIDPVAFVDAGLNDTLCEGSSAPLSASFSGSATSIIWSTSGDGSFDNLNIVNAVYTPGSGDIVVGSTTLYLTTNDPIGICTTETDSLILVVDPAATVSAGTDMTICDGDMALLSGSMGGAASTVAWTTSGDGSFDNNISLTPNYTPGATDISTGFVTLTITTDDPSGGCPSAVDNMLLNINTAPIVNAGIDATICQGSSYGLNATFGGSASSVFWTTSGDGTFGNAGLAVTTYVPGPTDISSGSVSLTINTNDPAGPCIPAADALTLTINPKDDPTFAYSTTTLCQTGPSVSPSSIVTPGGTFYEYSGSVVIDSVSGTINVGSSTLGGPYTISYVTSGICPDSSSIQITITNSPNSAFSYSDPFCQGGSNPFPSFSAGASAGVFSTNSPSLVLVGTLTGEINLSSSTPGQYYVYNTIVASGGCPQSLDSSLVTIDSLAFANAGTDQTICQGSQVTLNGSIGGSATSSIWTSSGDGFFDFMASLTANYTPGINDINSGSFSLTLNTNDPIGPCTATTDAMNVQVNMSPTINPGPDTTLCAGESLKIFATAGGSTTSVSWSTSGDGTFDNTSILTPTYSPGVNDINNGGTTIFVTTNDPAGPCTSIMDSVVININPQDTAAFVYTSGSYCTTGIDPIPTITGTGGGVFSSTPAGLIIDPNTGVIDLSASAVNSYNVTYTTSGVCNDSMTIVIDINIPPVDATMSYVGPICEAANTNPVPVYGPGASPGSFSAIPGGISFISVNTGEVDLAGSTPGTYTITNFIPPSGTCGATQDTAILVIDPAAYVTALPDTGVCLGDLAPVSATISGAATSVNWFTSGDGMFDIPTSVTPIYSPGPTDANNGIAIITVFTNDPPGVCPPDTDIAVLNIDPAAMVSAGPDNVICDGMPYVLNGSASGSTSTISWSTTGDGSFSNPAFINSSYTPGSNDISNGTVTLFITSNDPAGPCQSSVDSMTLTLNISGSVFAGNDTSLCAGSSLVLQGSSASGTIWSSGGDGSFDDFALLNATYFPGVNDLSSGNVTLTLTETSGQGGCNPGSDDVDLVIDIAPGINAGGDDVICEGSTFTTNATISGSASGMFWASSGDGGFNNNLLLASVYTPGANDISNGSVTLFATSNNPAGICNAVMDSMILSINLMNNVTAGLDVTVCEGDSAQISATLGVGATSGFWSTPGDGWFEDANQLNTYYTPGITDIQNGSVIISINSNDPDGAGPCPSAQDDLTVIVNPAPTISTAGMSLEDSHCGQDDGYIMGITASGGTTPYTYSWMDSVGTVISTSFANADISNLPTGTYSLIVTDNNGCSIYPPSGPYDINNNPGPWVDSSAMVIGPAVCGNSVGYINGIFATGGVAPYTYQWNNGDATLNINSLAENSYTVTITDFYGCDTTWTANVPGTDSAIVNIVANPDSGLVPLEVEFSTTGSSGTYEWYFGNSTSSIDSTPIATYDWIGNYTVTVYLTTEDGCTSSDTDTIYVYGNSGIITIPNVFTPNGDNVNDYFIIESENIKLFHCEIMSRWGEQIYEWNHPDAGWDGRNFSGVHVPEGSYFFMLEAEGYDGQKYEEKGAVTLIR